MKESKKASTIAGLAALAILILASVFFMRGGMDKKEPATFISEFKNGTFENSTQPTSSSELSFTLKVKNTSQTPGKPTCKVSGSNEDKTVYGSDAFEADKTLQSNEEWVFAGKISITNGSDKVSKLDVNCTEAT